MVNGVDMLHNETAGNEETLSINSTLKIGWMEGKKDLFSGKITDLNVWNRSLTLNELERFAFDCDESLFSPLQPVLWSKCSFTSKSSSLQVLSVKREKLCKISAPKTKIFPSKVTFEAAVTLCSHLAGKMPFPRNASEVIEVVKSSGKSYSNKCELQAWLPIVRSNVNSLDWVHYESVIKEVQTTVTFLPWAAGQPNGALIDQNCTIVTADSLGYSDIDCEDTYYFPCSLDSNYLFKLKVSWHKRTLYS